MAVSRLDPAVTLEPYAIIGKGAFGVPGGIAHVGLLKQAGTISAQDDVAVYECAPPLQTGQMLAQLAGWASLSDEQLEAIGTWVSSMVTAIPAQVNVLTLPKHYTVVPAIAIDRDPITRRVVRYRFSCVGFVVKAYDVAGIPLVDQSALPMVGEELLSQIWPELMGARAHPRLARIATAVGLGGSGPWPVLLPAYVFHALVTERTGAFKPLPEHTTFEVVTTSTELASKNPDGKKTIGVPITKADK